MYALIALSPFTAFVVISLFLQRTRRLAGWIATGSMLFSFCLVLKLFLALFGYGDMPADISHPWITLPGINFEIGFLFDRLSILMGMLVTGVGSMIFLFSMGYMEEDPGYARYFAFLSLFASVMLGIVFSTNFIQAFIFWELVGLASYLLIGFWFAKDSAADAAKKAFMVNRVGDFGFILGIIFIWFLSDLSGLNRTVDFAQLAKAIPDGLASGSISSLAIFGAGMLIFCGVVGKSAQIPLHVWLPDAMEGPTPVSALIHAATMVAAGVYLLARTYFIFTLSDDLLMYVGITGAVTCFVAATMGTVQTDIKRVLAYSTVSQLGYMVLAMGVSAPVAGMYHLMTHGFFKALLFLGAGSVIHMLETQNLYQMGGLTKKLPITSICFFIGGFALCGMFPFSGFFSKEEILAAAYARSFPLFLLGFSAVFLTSFYVGRMITIGFLGKSRFNKPAHESPFVMILPLLVLSVLAAFGGFFHIPALLGRSEIEAFEAPGIHESIYLSLGSTALVILGLGSSFLLYGLKAPVEGKDPLARILGPVYILLTKKYYFDELYNWYVAKIQQPFARLMDKANQWFVIKGLSNLSGEAFYRMGSYTRKMLTGNVQTYSLILIFQIVVVLTVAVFFMQLVK